MAEVASLPPPSHEELELASIPTGNGHSPPSPTNALSGMGANNVQALTFPKLNEVRRPQMSDTETQVFYQYEHNDLPIRIRVPIPPDQITLRDLKKALSIPMKTDYEFFFKSHVEGFGTAQEKIADDNAKLPFFGDKVVVRIKGEGSDHTSNSKHHPHHRRNRQYASSAFTDGDSTTGTESVISSRRGGQYLGSRSRSYKSRNRSHNHYGGYGDSSIATSDRDSYVFSDDDETFQDDIDSDEDDDYSSQMSSATEDTSVSRQRTYPKKNRHKWEMSRASSVTSFSVEAENVEVIEVRLNLDVVPWLGISLIGPPNGGIFVKEIMHGGAVHLDGRIQNNDKILRVNDVDLRELHNDLAVAVIQQAAKERKPIDLLILKTSALVMKKRFTIPSGEPVRPIDPQAWVIHTEAARAKFMNHDNFPTTMSSLNNSMERINLAGNGTLQSDAQQYIQHPSYPGMSFPAAAGPGSGSTFGPANGALPGSPLRQSFRGANLNYPQGSLPNSQLPHPSDLSPPLPHLSVDSDPELIALTMANPKYKLDVRERIWLKIRIPYAFIGSEAIDWLYKNVDGLKDKKAAKKLANRLLKEAFIEGSVSPSRDFSKNRYYNFSDEILAKLQLPVSNDPSVHSDQLLLQQHLAQQQQQQQNFQQNLLLGGDQQRPKFTSLTNEHLGVTSSGKPSYERFVRNWDETSEFHNYGYLGPDCGDDRSRASGNQRDQFSDEQSTRSGQSVLYNPNIKTMTMTTNTIGSNGSAGSRHTTNSAGKLVNSLNGVGSINPITGHPNMPLNHHYEDLQINPVTGNLMPASSNHGGAGGSSNGTAGNPCNIF